MPHGLEIGTDGRAKMFYAGEVPWHGLGTRVSEALTSREAGRAGGIAWSVGLEPVWGGFSQQLIPDQRAVVRQTDGAVLGIVSSKYQIIQNSDAFDFMDSLVTDGVMRYETAGSLWGGRRVWMLGRMEEGWRVADDQYEQYMLATTTHDGKGRFQGFPTSVRVVCNNTFRQAERGATYTARVAHYGNVSERLEEARRFLAITTQSQRNYQTWLETLASTKLEEAVTTAVQQTIFGSLDNTSSSRRKHAVERWRAVLDAEQRRVGSTVYALVQSVTGYASHLVRLRTTVEGEERMRSLVGGPLNAINQRGFAAIEQATGVVMAGVTTDDA